MKISIFWIILDYFSHQSDYHPPLWHLSEVLLEPDNPPAGDPDEAHQGPEPTHRTSLLGRTERQEEGAEEEDRTGNSGDLR